MLRSDVGNDLKIAVTGGSGCLGLAIIQCLRSRFSQAVIHVLDLSISIKNGTSNVVYHRIDICNATALSHLINEIQPQVLIHSAALIPSAARRLSVGREYLRKVNIQGTRNVLNAAKEVGSVQAFVYTSSCDVVKGDSWANLVNVDESCHLPQVFDETYPETKAVAEHLVLSAASSKFKTTSIRSHGIIGLNDTNIVPLLATAPRNISLGPGTNLYDFSSAKNVALAHALAVENLLSSSADSKKSANGKAFFVTDGRPMQLRQITDMIWDCLDYGEVRNNTLEMRTSKFVIPIPIAYCIVWLLSFFAKLMRQEPKLSTSELGDSVSVRYFDNSQAREVLGYIPVAKLEDSIRDACKTYKERNGSLGT